MAGMKPRQTMLTIMCFASSFLSGAAPIGIEKVRVLVSGPGFNRPDAFPGRGEFSRAEIVQRLPSGELLLMHSMG